MVGWVTSPFFSFLFLKASVLCTCISMYLHWCACMYICMCGICSLAANKAQSAPILVVTKSNIMVSIQWSLTGLNVVNSRTWSAIIHVHLAHGHGPQHARGEHGSSKHTLCSSARILLLACLWRRAF